MTATNLWTWHPNTVVIVDDNIELADSYKNILEQQGYEVMIYNSLKTAMEGIHLVQPGFLLLDVQLDESGETTSLPLLESLRKPIQQPVHVIVITGQKAKYPQVQMYAAGSDQYFSKPVAIEEILAYMHRVAEQRMGSGPKRRRIPLPDGELDLDSNVIFWNDPKKGTDDLTKSIAQLIGALIRAYPKPVSSETLERLIWPGGLGNQDNLRQLVWRSRKKLNCDSAIVNVINEGSFYRWGLKIPEDEEGKA